jgi:hypothetical protein
MIFDENEDQQELLSKCMANTEIKAEYADTDKRLAFCMAQSKKGKKTSVLAEVCDHLLAKNCSWDDEWDEFVWEVNTDFIYEEDGKTIAAEHNGKKVTLNKPFRTPDGPKKFAVYVKNNNGKVIIVRFGDPNLSIKRDDPNRRKSFRARHKCDQKKDKTTPGYWSCYQWRANSPVKD